MLFPSLQQIKDKNLTSKIEELVVKVQEGYAQFNVAYHNDLHGFDVLQMTYIVLNSKDGLSD